MGSITYHCDIWLNLFFTAQASSLALQGARFLSSWCHFNLFYLESQSNQSRYSVFLITALVHVFTHDRTVYMVWQCLFGGNMCCLQAGWEEKQLLFVHRQWWCDSVQLCRKLRWTSDEGTSYRCAEEHTAPCFKIKLAFQRDILYAWSCCIQIRDFVEG